MSLQATSTSNSLPLRAADFRNLGEALEYAAQGDTGASFYTGRAELYEALPYSRLLDEAKDYARRLIALDFKPGDRVVIIAETHPNFLRGFFACQFAGLIPVPVPIPIQMGSHAAYVRKTRDLLISAHATAVFTPDSTLALVTEACQGIDMKFVGDLATLSQQNVDPNVELHSASPDDTAYIQFTSGSTRFPRGVVIKQRAVLSNLARIIQDGIKIVRGDRFMSWLPFYHDMGLVGLVLVPVASQTSVDYLDTRDFAMRPRRWLELISRNKATISFSPPFGYELVERRLRENRNSDYDLSSWRIAGVGAETIRPEPLQRFSTNLARNGFRAEAFLPCYGMAECSLAISFAALDTGMQIETVDGDSLAQDGTALPIDPNKEVHHVARFVDCGPILPGHGLEVRDAEGQTVSERVVGTIHVKGPSVMSCYFENSEETERTLSRDGWLNTGDLGFIVDDHVYITGREKDLIIVNGRNIWPQDLEYLAEQHPQVRTGDALAFSAPGFENETTVVLVVQCRERDQQSRDELAKAIEQEVRDEIGISCFVKLVAPHTLPRTSSGKLSRSTARRNYMEQNDISEQYFRDQDETKSNQPMVG